METVEIILGIEALLHFPKEGTIGELIEGRVVLDDGLNMLVFLWTRSVSTAGERVDNWNIYKARLGHVTLPVKDIIESFGSQASETVSVTYGGGSLQ
jgi:hypothetical protein